jgi:hypothetical protein
LYGKLSALLLFSWPQRRAHPGGVAVERHARRKRPRHASARQAVASLKTPRARGRAWACRARRTRT